MATGVRTRESAVERLVQDSVAARAQEPAWVTSCTVLADESMALADVEEAARRLRMHTRASCWVTSPKWYEYEPGADSYRLTLSWDRNPLRNLGRYALHAVLD
jgi:hypothetical protein